MPEMTHNPSTEELPKVIKSTDIDASIKLLIDNLVLKITNIDIELSICYYPREPEPLYTAAIYVHYESIVHNTRMRFTSRTKNDLMESVYLYLRSLSPLKSES